MKKSRYKNCVPTPVTDEVSHGVVKQLVDDAVSLDRRIREEEERPWRLRYMLIGAVINGVLIASIAAMACGVKSCRADRLQHAEVLTLKPIN